MSIPPPPKWQYDYAVTILIFITLTYKMASSSPVKSVLEHPSYGTFRQIEAEW